MLLASPKGHCWIPNASGADTYAAAAIANVGLVVVAGANVVVEAKETGAKTKDRERGRGERGRGKGERANERDQDVRSKMLDPKCKRCSPGPRRPVVPGTSTGHWSWASAGRVLIGTGHGVMMKRV